MSLGHDVSDHYFYKPVIGPDQVVIHGYSLKHHPGSSWHQGQPTVVLTRTLTCTYCAGDGRDRRHPGKPCLGCCGAGTCDQVLMVLRNPEIHLDL